MPESYSRPLAPAPPASYHSVVCGSLTPVPYPLPPVETGSPFGTLWAGLGLGGFYIALIWINSLLGLVLTPLMLLPATFLMDRRKKGAAKQ